MLLQQVSVAMRNKPVNTYLAQEWLLWSYIKLKLVRVYFVELPTQWLGDDLVLTKLYWIVVLAVVVTEIPEEFLYACGDSSC